MCLIRYNICTWILDTMLKNILILNNCYFISFYLIVTNFIEIFLIVLKKKIKIKSPKKVALTSNRFIN